MSNSPLANPSAAREILHRFGLQAKYSLGQNFLVDDNVIGNIIKLAGLEDAQGASLCEIGPGMGTLTVALLDHGSVVSVEQDRDMVPVLAETTSFNSDRFALLNMDALKCQPQDILDAAASLGAPAPTMLVSNLPYAVAATVILDWFQRFDFLSSMTVMVQSEVADRIAAQKGTKNYGAYTVKLRLHATVSGRFQVPATCFLPAPRVESAVIRLDRCPQEGSPQLLEAACHMADAAFAQRRKNIRNSMKGSMGAAVVDQLLSTCGIDPGRRGETLDVADFLALGQAFLDLSL